MGNKENNGLGIRRSPNDHYADEYSKNFEVEFDGTAADFSTSARHCDAMHGAELLDQILHLSRPGGPGKRRKRTAERRPLP
uniref:Transposase n=1 Tax=Macrostomum lignano TaxID=282301 RepID=A0A1I8F8U6_9PLAT